MDKLKKVLCILISVLLLYILGECFLLLDFSEKYILGSRWIATGYFISTFIVICLFCFWQYNENFGKRILFVLLIYFLSWVLDFVMAGLGVTLTFQNLLGIPDMGEFGIAAAVMYKGSILFYSMTSATIISQIILGLYHLWKRKKE